MSYEWKTIFKGSFENRPVRIDISSENDYRIITTQGEDYEGFVEVSDGSLTHIPTSEKGTEIYLEGVTKEELISQLKSEKFNDKSINEIINKF